MTTLTLAIEDDLLQRARARAQGQGLSVHSLLRKYLETYAGARNARNEIVDEILEASSKAGSRRAGRGWTRDELHER